MGKNLDPTLKPEKQHAISKQESMERPHIGQGRAGSRRKIPDPINQPISQPSNLSQKIPGRTKIETGKTYHIYAKDLTHSINRVSGKMTNKNPLIPDVPSHPSPVHRPTPKIQSSQSSTSIEDINSNINFDFKEKFFILRRSYVQNISEARQIIFSGTQRIGGSCK